MHSAMIKTRNDILNWIERKFLETKKKKDIERLVYIQRMTQLRTLIMSRRTFVTENEELYSKPRKINDARMNILHHSDQIKYTHSILHDAILAGDSAYCIRLIKLTNDIILSTDTNKVLIGYADLGLLHYATYKNMPDVVRLLLQPPWSLNPLMSLSLPFREIKGHLWNPHQVASYKGNLECCKLFMDLLDIKKDADYIILQNVLDCFKLAFYSRKDECSADMLCWFQEYCDKDINLTISILKDEIIYFSVSNQMNKTLAALLQIATSIINKVDSLDSNICSASLMESLINEFYLAA
jgi:hypothetical protein